jgi:hypothetical protein
MPKWPKKKQSEFSEDPDLAEEIPRVAIDDAVIEPGEQASEFKVRKKRGPNKKKPVDSGEPVPVAKELITLAADGALSIASTGYQLIRKGPELRYEPQARLQFTTLLGRWFEEQGLAMPLWAQVVLAGGACVVPAVMAAEAERNGHKSNVVRFAVPAPFVPPEQRASGSTNPAPEVRPAPADRGSGYAGERQDLAYAEVDQSAGA